MFLLHAHDSFFCSSFRANCFSCAHHIERTADVRARKRAAQVAQTGQHNPSLPKFSHVGFCCTSHGTHHNSFSSRISKYRDSETLALCKCGLKANSKGRSKRSRLVLAGKPLDADHGPADQRCVNVAATKTACHPPFEKVTT